MDIKKWLRRALNPKERRYQSIDDIDAWLDSRMGMLQAANSGVNVTERTALNYSVVYACVRVLAETVSSLPLPVYRRLSPRGKVRDINHPLYEILHDQPNSEMTSMTFRETMMGHLNTWGNCYAEIEYDAAGEVKGLWPLRPDKMEIGRDEKTKELKYRYTLPGAGGKAILPAYRVFHVPGLGFDGLKGYSPIAMAREAIGVGLATEEYGARYFSNSAVPPTVLKHPGALGDKAHERLRKWIDGQIGGLANAQRMAILEEGMEIEAIGIPPEDSQFLETRRFQIEEIARIYRVPLHLVQHHEKTTSWGTGIEHINIGFVVYTIQPWLVRWEQVIKMKLFFGADRKSHFAEFLVDALLRGDIKSRYEAYAIARQWGFMNADEIRDKENMNPQPNGQGQIYLSPLNMIPADQAGLTLESKKEEKSRRALPEVMLKRSGAMRKRLRSQYRGLFLDAAKRVVRKEKADVMRAAKKQLKSSKNEFLDFIEKYYNDFPEYIKRQMAPTYNSYMQAAAAEAEEEVGVERQMTTEQEDFTNDYVESYANRHAGSSLGQLGSLVREAESEEEAFNEVEERLNEWDEKRADTIADTEIVRAESAMASAVFVSAGFDLRWFASGPEPCPYCESLDGTVISSGQVFVKKGEEFEPEGADGPLINKSDIGHPSVHKG